MRPAAAAAARAPTATRPCGSAREGCEALLPLPQAILLDMQMPRLGGREVLRAMHRDGRWPSIAVFVMTASRVHRVLLEAEGLHVAGYLTKPVTPAQCSGAFSGLS